MKKQSFYILFLTLFSFGCVGHLHAQLTVDESVTAAGGVQNVLMGGGVEASNITFAGNEETQIGFFQCNGCGIGLTSGLVLGSGKVSGAIGPNSSGSFSLGPPNMSDSFGDPDLGELAGNSIHNAAILEFDFIPTGDEIAFNFVFSSEEYPEYVNSVNDVFGFFISGPGISGPYTNNSANIALIPNTTDAVTINTVNDEVNTAYYVANHNADNSPAQFFNVQADGFTTVLTARADVECGETYHIKIAIGDASDGAWDSWVFLEEGSFSSAPLELTFVQPTLAPGIENGMYEDCGIAPLTFHRPPCTTGDYTFNITYSGTVGNGIDIEELPATVVIPDGQDEYVLPLITVNDGVSEGVENLVFFTQVTLSDGEVVDIEFELLIYDHPGLTLAVQPDDNDVCPDAPVNLEAMVDNVVGGATYLWSTNQTTPEITVSSFATEDYSVTVTDGCGYTITSNHTVDVLPYTQDLTVPLYMFELCSGIPSGPIVNGGIPPYTYDLDPALLEFTDNGFYSEAEFAITEITVTDVCGNTASFDMTIWICDTTIPNIFTPNGDAANNRFEIKGIQAFTGSSLFVYNRWGKLIFESNNYRNDWSASEEEEGNYFYIFKRSDGLEYSGYVMVVR